MIFTMMSTPSSRVQAPRSALQAGRSRHPVRVTATAEPVATDAAAWEFVISKDALLKSPNRRAAGTVEGVGPVAVFWHSNKPFAVQGNCPHLGIPLASGKIDDKGAIVCSQHKSSWDLETGAVDEYLPGGLGNKLQRMLSPACPLATFEAKVEDEMVYVKKPASA